MITPFDKDAALSSKSGNDILMYDLYHGETLYSLIGKNSLNCVLNSFDECALFLCEKDNYEKLTFLNPNSDFNLCKLDQDSFDEYDNYLKTKCREIHSVIPKIPTLDKPSAIV